MWKAPLYRQRSRLFPQAVQPCRKLHSIAFQTYLPTWTAIPPPTLQLRKRCLCGCVCVFICRVRTYIRTYNVYLCNCKNQSDTLSIGFQVWNVNCRLHTGLEDIALPLIFIVVLLHGLVSVFGFYFLLVSFLVINGRQEAKS